MAVAPTTQPTATASTPATQPIVTGVDTTPIIEDGKDIDDDFDPGMPNDDGSNDD